MPPTLKIAQMKYNLKKGLNFLSKFQYGERFLRLKFQHPMTLCWACSRSSGRRVFYPKMLNSIYTQHQNNNIIFCPDLASCHYAKRIRERLEQNTVNYVQKQDNAQQYHNLGQSKNFLCYCAEKFIQFIILEKFQISCH